MVRSRFDGQIACLNEELVIMGSLCERAIGKVAEALGSEDAALVS